MTFLISQGHRHQEAEVEVAAEGEEGADVEAEEVPRRQEDRI